jgi:hypothetical protein
MAIASGEEEMSLVNCRGPNYGLYLLIEKMAVPNSRRQSKHYCWHIGNITVGYRFIFLLWTGILDSHT